MLGPTHLGQRAQPIEHADELLSGAFVQWVLGTWVRARARVRVRVRVRVRFRARVRVRVRPARSKPSRRRWRQAQRWQR